MRPPPPFKKIVDVASPLTGESQTNRTPRRLSRGARRRHLSRLHFVESLEPRLMMAADIGVFTETVIAGHVIPHEFVSNVSRIELGTTPQGTPVRQILVVENRGDSPLTLDPNGSTFPTGVRAVPGFATTLGPGASTPLELELLATDVGRIDGIVSIASNDSDENPFRIRVSGQVLPPAPDIAVSTVLPGMTAATELVSPLATLLFPRTVVGRPLEQQFTLSNTGSGPLNFATDSILLPAGYHLVGGAPTTLGAGENAMVTIRLDPAEPGIFSGYLTIATDDPDEAVFRVYLLADVAAAEPEIAIETDSPFGLGTQELLTGAASVFFPATFAGQSIDKTFTVRNLGTAPLVFHADEIVIPNGFRLLSPPPATLAPGATASFALQLVATSTGIYSGTVVIPNDDPNESRFEFFVVGSVSPAPFVTPEVAVFLEVEPGTEEPLLDDFGSVSFGTIAVGATASRNVIVRNVGTAALTLESSGFALPAGFEWVTVPAEVVAPGESTTLTIALTASTPGHYGGKLQLATNDLDEDPIGFSLVGRVSYPFANSTPTLPGPVPNVSVVTGAAPYEIALASLFLDADVSQGDILNFALTQNTNAGLVQAVLDGSTLRLTFVPGGVGTSQLTVRATDLAGAMVNASFSVTVSHTAAMAALPGLIASAEANYSAAVATASAGLVSTLASYSGNTTSFELSTFEWPSTPNSGAWQFPGDGAMPGPPSAESNGGVFSYVSDNSYNAALATIDSTYSATVNAAQQAYISATGAAFDTLGTARQTAWDAHATAVTAAYATFTTATAASHPTIDLAALGNAGHATLVAAYEAYGVAITASEATYRTAIEGATNQESVRQDRARRHRNANARRTMRHAESAAFEPYTHATYELEAWKRERDATAYEDLQRANEAAERVRQRDFATAFRNYRNAEANAHYTLTVAIAGAQAIRTRGAASARESATAAYDAVSNTAWSQYQLDQAIHHRQFEDAASFSRETLEVAAAAAERNRSLVVFAALHTESLALIDGWRDRSVSYVEAYADHEIDRAVAVRDYDIAVFDRTQTETRDVANAERIRERTLAEVDETLYVGMFDRLDIQAAAHVAASNAYASHQSLYTFQFDTYTANEAYDTSSVTPQKDHAHDVVDAEDTFWEAIYVAQRSRNTAVNNATRLRDVAYANAEEAAAVSRANADAQWARDQTDAMKVRTIDVADADRDYVVALLSARDTFNASLASLGQTLATQSAADAKTLGISVASDHQAAVASWDLSQNTRWSTYQERLADSALGWATNGGNAESTFVGVVAAADAAWTTSVSTAEKNYGTTLADAAYSRIDATAGALATHSHELTDARETYEVSRAAEDRSRDTDEATHRLTLFDEQANLLETLSKALDQARWNAEYREANIVATRATAQIGVDYVMSFAVLAELFGSNQPSALAAISQTHSSSSDTIQAAATNARSNSAHTKLVDIEAAQRSHRISLAQKRKDYTASIGDTHVTWTENTSEDARQFADDYRDAGNDLALDLKTAGVNFATSLGAATRARVTGLSLADANHEFSLDGAAGTLRLDLNGALNQQREQTVAARGGYEAGQLADHASAQAVALSASSSATPDQQILAQFQSNYATADATWANGIVTDTNAFHDGLTTAADLYALQFNVSDSARSLATQVARAFHGGQVGVTLEAYLVDSGTAVAEAGEEVLRAQVKRVRDDHRAEADYRDDEAREQRSRANSYADADVAFESSVAYADETFHLSPQLPANVTAHTNAHETALQTRYADYRAAESTFETNVGDKRIDRVTALGDHLVTRAEEIGDAGIDLAASLGAAEQALVGDLVAHDATLRGQLNLVESTHVGNVASLDQTFTQQIGVAQNTLQTDRNGRDLARATAVASATTDQHIGMHRLAVIAAAEAIGVSPGVASLLPAMPLGTVFAGALPTTASPNDVFTVVDARSRSHWMETLAPSFTALVTASAAADAAHASSVTSAVVTQANAQAAADSAHMIAEDGQVRAALTGAASAWESFQSDIVGHVAAFFNDVAADDKVLDVAYGQLVKQQAVDFATADKNYFVGMVPTYWSTTSTVGASVTHAYTVAQANANAGRERREADADHDWSRDVSTLIKTFETSYAGSAKTLLDSLAGTEKSFSRGLATAEKNWSRATVNAESAAWTAESSAANTWRTAQGSAYASFHSADLAAQTAAVGGMHGTLSLPWSGAQAAIYTTQQSTWTTTNQSAYLGYVASANAEHTAYDTSVRTSYVDQSRAAIDASHTFAHTAADELHVKRLADALAERTYSDAVSAADETYLHAILGARRTHRIASANAEANYVDTDDYAAYGAAIDSAGAALTSAREAAATAHHTSTAAASGAKNLALAQADLAWETAFGSAHVTWTTAVETAQEAFTHAWADATDTRRVNLTNLHGIYASTSATAAATDMALLALTSSDPWTDFESDKKTALATKVASEASAQLSAETAESGATRDALKALAADARVGEITRSTDTATSRKTVAQSKVDAHTNASASTPGSLVATPDASAPLPNTPSPSPDKKEIDRKPKADALPSDSVSGMRRTPTVSREEEVADAVRRIGQPSRLDQFALGDEVFESAKGGGIAGDLRIGANWILRYCPIIADGTDAIESYFGKNAITGEPLSRIERGATTASVVVPFVPGSLVRRWVRRCIGETASEVAQQVARRVESPNTAIRHSADSVTGQIGNGVVDAGSNAASLAPISGLKNATRLSPNELATGQRLEAILGKTLRESPHSGAEYIDDLGRTYDAFGQPNASKFWNPKKFFESLDHHLLKSNDFTVIDLTGFSPQHIAEVEKYLAGLSPERLKTIIRIGF